jgi:hypothetical protein
VASLKCLDCLENYGKGAENNAGDFKARHGGGGGVVRWA